MTTGPQLPAFPAARTSVHPYSAGKRAFYGITWTIWTIVLVIAGFALLAQAQVLPGLVGLALSALTARYAYRIWTWQARRLIFLIIF